MTSFTKAYLLGCATGFALSFLFGLWFWSQLI